MLKYAVLLAGFAILGAGQPQESKTQEPPKEKVRPRIRFGGFTLNAGYSRMSGVNPYWGYPYFYRYSPAMWGWGPPFYDPFFYGLGSFIHPGFYTGFGFQPSLGEVKVKGADPKAWVYVDGALAGRADKLKNMWLEPGAYNLEVRTGQRKVGQKIYVLSGKTLNVTPDMMEVRQ